MRRNGTDMMALACIVGGGVVAGGVTLALASGPELPSLECATTVGPDANVVVALGGEGVVVVTPDVRLREVQECMQLKAAQNTRIELTRLMEHDRQSEMERAEREVERARREADRVRREVDRVRERVLRVDGVRIERQQERARRQMVRARERAERARARVETIHLDGTGIEIDGDFLEGFSIDLPDQTFEFRFEGLDGLEFEGLEDALRIQLDVLEGLEFEFEDFDEDLEDEIEQRIEEKMRQLKERLERLGDDIGR